MSDVTRILNSIGSGDPESADELLALVYDDLRRLAAARMSDERAGHTLQATALVHEAWIRLAGPEGEALHWNNRRHLYAAAAEAMRRILIEKARRKKRLRHGGDLQRVAQDQIEISTGSREEQLLAVDEALEELTRLDPRKAEVVKLRYFIGMSNEETAEAMDLSLSTVVRYWAYAKAWLADRVPVVGDQAANCAPGETS